MYQLARLFCLIFFLLGQLPANAIPKCKLESISTEQGLSHQAVTDILKDREGFMWFCTWDGLNRFDGQKFVTYKSAPGDHSQLQSDRLDMMIEDGKGDLWVEAYDHNVYCFKKTTGRFLPLAPLLEKQFHQYIAINRIIAAVDGWIWLASSHDGLFAVPEDIQSGQSIIHYTIEQTSNDQSASNEVLFFKVGKDQKIWVGTSKGVACLEKTKSGKYASNQVLAKTLRSPAGISCFDEDDHSWYFGTRNGQLLICNKQTLQVQTRQISHAGINSLHRWKLQNKLYAGTNSGELLEFDIDADHTSSFNMGNSGLLSIYEDRKGKLWIEPTERGVIRFDPANYQFHHFISPVKEGHNNNNVGITFAVFEDRDNRVWVNMKAGGFGYYNEETAAMAFTIATEEASQESLPNFVYNTYYDKTGIVWFTTNDRQLVKLVLQNNSIHQKILVEKPENRWDNEVRGMAFDRLNRLWVGAKSGRLYVFDGEKQVNGIFDNPPAGGLGLIYSILPDSRGNIWLGTKSNGLFKAIPVNGDQSVYHLQHFTVDRANSFGLITNEIYSMVEDGPGRIWIGSYDSGLSLAIDDASGTRFLHRENYFASLPASNKKIRSMVMDNLGHLWIGSTSGLLVMDHGKKQPGVYRTRTFTKIKGNPGSLGNNDVQFVFRDDSGHIWLGTSGGGFSRIISTDPFADTRFVNYTSRQGMPNDYVLSITQDLAGDIWIATENGLSCFDVSNEKFRNYDAYDGFPRSNFSESSVVRNNGDGSLVFGSTRGIIYFNPLQISKNVFPGNIAFTHLQVNNRSVGPGQIDELIHLDVNYLGQLELKYNQNILSIDYAVLDNRTGVKQPAEYRLIGFDTVWHEDRKLRRATYTNLPPGHYTFQVRAGNTDAYSNQPYRELNISILPPPWKTWWAYLLYAISIFVILFFARRTAVTMIRLRQKIALEQKLADLKSNFFTQVSHELRTPLTLIQSPIEQMLRKEPLSFEGRSNAELARKNANRMLRFVNQLLDFRKVEANRASLHYATVEIVSFTRSICDHYVEAARSKQVSISVNASVKKLNAWVDADKLDVVLYNIIGNALKFTPRGKAIDVNIDLVGDHQFMIAVCDQGPGVKKDQLKHIFELFNDVNQASAGEQKGSGIGLALSSEFVKLHQGDIWADNNAFGGLTVSVKLNIGKPGTGEQESETIYATSYDLSGSSVATQILRPYTRKPAVARHEELVLLVEDNDDLRLFLQQRLSESYRVEIAENGELGWQKALELGPDLVLTDVMMPVMNGIQLLEKLKNDVQTSHIPVVLLTAKSSVESQIEGMQYGADFYITKPFNMEHLLASIENLVRQRKRLFESLVVQKSWSGAQGSLQSKPLIITSRDEAFLKAVVKLVEEKMAEPGFTMETLAADMAMSRSTFAKKFKSLTSLTTVEFVKDMRLQKSLQLLEAGYQVAEVAYTVGFSNPKYFSTCFREKYHMSPSDYTRSQMLE